VGARNISGLARALGWAGIEENSDETAVVISRQIYGHPMTGDDVITDELYERGPAVRHDLYCGIPAMVDGFATASRVFSDDLTMED
jgi:hypothetical protein